MFVEFAYDFDKDICVSTVVWIHHDCHSRSFTLSESI